MIPTIPPRGRIEYSHDRGELELGQLGKATLKACNVYLVWHHLLLRDTVRAILQQNNLTIVGESHGVDPTIEIFALHPDVVLVEEEEGWTGKLLAIMPRLKSTHLVSINMADNKLYIYYCEERMLNQMSDLIVALEFSN